MIQVLPPGFDILARAFPGDDLIDVQTLVPQSPIERHVHVFARLSGTDEVELDATLPCRLLERRRREFGSMIEPD
jgi:hypothetical protein